MIIGIAGLGRMGQGYARRLTAASYRVYGYDITPPPSSTDYTLVPSLAQLVTSCDLLILAIPHSVVSSMLTEVCAVSSPRTSVVLDMGNTPFTQAVTHAELLAARTMQFADVGVSGGVSGQEHGYCLMVGCAQEIWPQLEPICQALACPGGSRRVGPVSTGHYVKMVHNAIEYTMLQAYGEGINLLHRSPTAVDIGEVMDLWQHGSLIRSRLLQDMVHITRQEPHLLDNNGVIPISSFVMQAHTWAHNEGIRLPALEQALAVRLATHSGITDYGTRLIAAVRNVFGGHPLVMAPEDLASQIDSE